MAAGTTDGHPQKDGSGGINPIDHVANVNLFVNRAAFAGGHVCPIETRGNLLIKRRVGKQISSQLLDHKLIKRQIAVEGPHHPVSIGPHLSVVIQVQPVGIAIASGIEPEPGHMLTVVGRLHEPVNHFFVSVWRGIGQKGINFLRSGWQAGQVQRDPADQSFPVHFSIGGKLFGFQASQHKGIDGGLDPALVLNGGNGRGPGRLKRPVVSPRGALLDPGSEQLDLIGGQFSATARWRHQGVGIIGFDPGNQFTLIRVAGRDRVTTIFECGKHAVTGIQSQPGLPLFFVGAVARKAIIGNQRPDLTIEVDLRARIFGPNAHRGEGEGHIDRRGHE